VSTSNIGFFSGVTIQSHVLLCSALCVCPAARFEEIKFIYIIYQMVPFSVTLSDSRLFQRHASN